MTQTTYTTVSAISIVTGETATTTIDHDRLDMAIRGATICLQHWQGEDDTELVADAMARLDRLQRLAAGETGIYGCIEAVFADIDGAIDWLDEEDREDTTITTNTTSPTTREQLVASLETEKDPIGAVIAYIRDEMSGLVRHDLDAKNNGWDPFEYPENGHIWHEAEGILLEAAGVEDLDDLEGIYDDAYADLVDAIGTLLEGDEDMAIEALVEAWDETVDEGFGEVEMAQSLIEQIEGGRQGWDASVEDAEDHPDIALMIGLDPEAEPEDPDEMEDLWETWGRVVGEAARRWLARHPEAARTAREEE